MSLATLLVFIDDATGRLMQLRLVASESTSPYFDCLRDYLDAHGCPAASYSEEHSVFRINREAQGGAGMTQFGRALAELNIETICANSSQAKGRINRVNRTLHAGSSGKEPAYVAADPQATSSLKVFVDLFWNLSVNPTGLRAILAKEVLVERCEVEISRESLRKWMSRPACGCHAAAQELPPAKAAT